MRFRVEKLIRDGLPAMMRASGLRVFERALSPTELGAALRAKLVEEAEEAAAAATPQATLEELADVLEVLLALAETEGLTLEDVETARRIKREARGGFAAGIYNQAVEADEDCPAAAYYLARPGQYPRLD